LESGLLETVESPPAPPPPPVPSIEEDPMQTQDTMEAVSKPRPVSPTARIMIIDDDRDVISYMLAFLHERFEIFGVYDPIAAVYKIIRYQPDLIILDVSMPRMSGYQLSQLLRLNRNLRTIKILFASSKDSPEEIAYAKKLGAADYLTKPFKGEDLIHKVTAIVDGPNFIIREKALSFDEIRRAESNESLPAQFS
jgi:PleD family two-component response regulator